MLGTGSNGEQDPVAASLVVETDSWMGDYTGVWFEERECRSVWRALSKRWYESGQVPGETLDTQ